MPYLLMSNESLKGTTWPAKSHSNSRIQEHQPFPGVDPDLEPLRRQVADIIDAVLADTKPEEAEVREKIRWHIAANPGRPEKALLSHLLSVSVPQDAAG
ncbi:hypothetical protein BJG92_01476 [Arthrobacter sp. SO5]|uniref:hypothetical protein n=1 Tax=Arthrobacter sp. SO5 TaxID=1897055 RepID=UPI001E480556|nr:hypothetical protein [Arthrobacter sp. SO5]MCB5273950.1 hypothetical protein [Arthrobacter sp. SO5]